MSGRTGGPGRGGGLVIGQRERGGSRLRAPSLTRMAAFLPSAPTHSSHHSLPRLAPPLLCSRYNLMAVDLNPYGTGVG